MPEYDFECSCGKIIERTFAMSEVKPHVRCTCGKMAKRRYHVPNKRVWFRNWVMDPSERDARVTRGRGY